MSQSYAYLRSVGETGERKVRRAGRRADARAAEAGGLPPGRARSQGRPPRGTHGRVLPDAPPSLVLAEPPAC